MRRLSIVMSLSLVEDLNAERWVRWMEPRNPNVQGLVASLHHVYTCGRDGVATTVVGAGVAGVVDGIGGGVCAAANASFAFGWATESRERVPLAQRERDEFRGLSGRTNRDDNVLLSFVHVGHR